MAGRNKYIELKKSWGTGAPLNSNYLLITSLCAVCSIVGDAALLIA